MYKRLTANDYRKHLKLPIDYVVDSFVVYGTYKKHPFEQFEDSVKRSGRKYTKRKLEHDFFDSLVEFTIEDKRVWVAIAYGGALLSEYMHLACLFGSRVNVLIGSCGGLKKGAHELELVVPDYSFANESSAAAYQPSAENKYSSDDYLSDMLTQELSQRYVVHRGATITFQAMLAETWEDITSWSEGGYVAVEMEAATVFAVSSHFHVPAAAILLIGDNLIEEKTVVDVNYEDGRSERRAIAQFAFDVCLGAIFKL